jgi:predicted dehydrogenase
MATTHPRIAVIGGGHLGRIHAKLAAANSNCELVAVADPSADSRSLVESQLHLKTVSDYRTLKGQVDAAIIVTPTFLHHEVGLWCLNNGIHTFIEKPIASSIREANELVACAAARSLSLQVGHVERFNPAWQSCLPKLQNESIQYIEAAREGTYTGRSTDIGIVMDLMIHDLDLILSAVDSPVDQIHAYGWSVLGEHEDFAVANLRFASGTIAALRASRISPTPKRFMQIYTDLGLVEIDFATSSIRETVPTDEVADRTKQADMLAPNDRAKVKDTLFREWLVQNERKVPACNAIELEQNEFYSSISRKTPVTVTGHSGAKALEVAVQIIDCIELTRPARSIIPSATRFATRKAA